jgi:hypothetical protein
VTDGDKSLCQIRASFSPQMEIGFIFNMKILATIASLYLICSSLGTSAVVLDYNTGRPYLSPIATQPRTQVSIPYYDEDGFRSKPFGPILSSGPFALSLAGPNSDGLASNGTAHLSMLGTSSFEVFSQGGLLFDAVSVDLGEYSTVFTSPKLITFEGVIASGGSVFVDFTTDGFVQGGAASNDFQTFIFPPEFSNLLLLRSATIGYSLDNLTLRAIPEPALLPMLSICMLGILTNRTRKCVAKP